MFKTLLNMFFFTPEGFDLKRETRKILPSGQSAYLKKVRKLSIGDLLVGNRRVTEIVRLYASGYSMVYTEGRRDHLHLDNKDKVWVIDEETIISLSSQK